MLDNIGLSVLWFTHMTLCEGMHTVEHTHQFFHFGASLSGSRRHDATGAMTGRVYCSLPGVPHGNTTIVEEERCYECKFIVTDPVLYERLVNFPFDKVVLDSVSETLLKIIACDIRKYAPPAEHLNLAFFHFITRLMDVHSYLLTSGSSEDLARRVREYIDEHYAEKLTLAQMADHFGFCRSYLSRAFSQTAGSTIFSYLNYVRVKAACNLIAYTDEPIKNIYPKCGFVDLHNFGRVFKQYVGVTPSVYRRNHDPELMSYRGDDGLLDCQLPRNRYFTYAAVPQKYVPWHSYRAFLNQEDADL